MEHTVEMQIADGKKTVILASAQSYLPMLALTYHLHAEVVDRVASRLWITVATEDESECAWVGWDLGRAVEYFDRIVQGRVTPCTLQDVVSDLQWQDAMR